MTQPRHQSADFAPSAFPPLPTPSFGPPRHQATIDQSGASVSAVAGRTISSGVQTERMRQRVLEVGLERREGAVGGGREGADQSQGARGGSEEERPRR